VTGTPRHPDRSALRRAAEPATGAGRTVWIGVALMLLSLLVPWVELRPNRLSDGEPLRLGAHAWTLLPLAVLVGVTVRHAVIAAILANAALLGGVVLLGSATHAALEEQLPVARAGAGPGAWTWLLGAGVAVWGATFELRERSRRLGLLAWGWLPLAVAFAAWGGLASWSVWQEGQVEAERLGQEAWQHVRLVGQALGCAMGIGAPLAVWASRNAEVARVALSVTGAVQTIPSLALLGLLIAPLSFLADRVPVLREVGVSGIGVAPALVALTLYALLPIVRNGVVALGGVSVAALDAATGMGMTAGQRFWRVELPLALPVWIAGARQATVLLIGVTSVAALIGAGGLGVYIFRGLNSAATDLILLGAIPASLLALAADGAWRAAEQLLTRRFGRVEGREP